MEFLLTDLHQLTAKEGVVLAVVIRTERVDTHIHANKAVTAVGLHPDFVAFYIC